MRSHPAVLEVRRLSKSYMRNARPAVDNASFQLHAGERLGLVGANGSGKTTLIRLLMNLMVPDEGEISICGEAQSPRSARWIGFIPERQEGLENFTPRELFWYAARMFALSDQNLADRIEAQLTFTGLASAADHLVGAFSKGMAQRVQLGLALLHNPRILLLDEPMSGLDPGGQRDIRRLFEALDGPAIVYASHDLEVIEEFCSRVLILHEGKIVQDVSLSDMRPSRLTFQTTTAGAAQLAGLKTGLSPVIHRDGATVHVEIPGAPEELEQLLARLSEMRVPVDHPKSSARLADLYHRYVTFS